MIRGARYVIAASLALASAGAMIKIAAGELPNAMVVWLRAVFGLLLLLPWLWRTDVTLHTQRLRLHLLRACFGVGAMYCFFFAISDMLLANAVLLNYSQPLFIPFIAWAWLAERPPTRIFPAVLIGFAGVGLILKPTLGLVSTAGLLGLASGLLAAVAMVCIRRMSTTEPTLRIVFYFTTLATVLTTPAALWHWQTPDPASLAAMAGAGLFATVGQLLLTRAYALAPAAHVGSMVYATVIFAALWGYAVWGEVIDGFSALGTALVIVSGCVVVFMRRRPAPMPVD